MTEDLFLEIAECEEQLKEQEGETITEKNSWKLYEGIRH